MRNRPRITHVILEGGNIALPINDDDLVQCLQTCLEKKITHLDLSGLGIRSHQADIIAKFLSMANFLQQLNLAKNKLSTAELFKLCIVLSKHKALTHLNLSHNKISARDIEPCLHLLRMNKSISFLSFAANQLGNLGTRSVINILSENQLLKFVDLSDNRLKYLGLRDKRFNFAKKIPDAFYIRGYNPMNEQKQLRKYPELTPWAPIPWQLKNSEQAAIESLLDFLEEKPKSKDISNAEEKESLAIDPAPTVTVTKDILDFARELAAFGEERGQVTPLNKLQIKFV